jgi:hypothetical protein
MIRTIKLNTPLNYLLMLALMLVLWGFKFYYMPTPIETYEVSNWLIPNFPETIFFKYLSAGISFILLYLFAVIIIRSNSNLMIVENGYQSPGIIFVLLTGIFINVQRILPETIVSLTLFLAVIRIFNSYNYAKAYANMLDAGILTAISIFLFHKLIFIIPIIIIIIIIIRPIKWREITMFFSGLLLTILVGICLIWLFGDLPLFYSGIQSALETKYSTVKYTTFIALVFSPILILSLVALLSRFSINIPRKVSTRKFQTSLVIILAVLSIFLISPHATNESIVLLFPFLSLLISNIIINARQIIVYLIFWGLILSLVITQIIQIIYYLSLY